MNIIIQKIPSQLLSMETWIFLAVLILAVLAVNLLLRWLLGMRLRRIKPEEHMWSHALLSASSAPVRALIWLLGVALIRQKLAPKGTEPLIDEMYFPVMSILITFVTMWFLLRIVNRVKSNYIAYADSRNETIDRTAIGAISKLAWAFVLVFALISILQQLGVSLASLLAFGGAAGIAVGFAAQNLVANLFGGLTVYASRIFNIGEDIIFPGTSLAGTVQQIGWRSTRVLGWDGKPFYVPNSVFNASNMVNHSRLTHRTISEYILLRYRDIDKVATIVGEGNELLEKHKDIGYFVFRFDSFGDRALKLYIYAWVQTVPSGRFLPYAEFMRIKEELLLSIADIARDRGCELIMPVSNLYLREGWQPETSEALADIPTDRTTLAQDPGETGAIESRARPTD